VRKLHALFFSLASLGLGACGSDIGFAVQHHPDFKPEAHSVSFFGVYKDGRMSTDIWRDLGPRFAAALGNTCEPIFGEALVKSDQALAEAVDDQARSEGITDGLLSAFAPAAVGDSILLISISGQLGRDAPTHAPRGGPPPSNPSMGAPNRGGARYRGGAGGPNSGMMLPESGVPTRGAKTGGLDLIASLYDVQTQKTVAVVAMKYTGKNEDEALNAFVERLRTELPGTRCIGWKPDVKVGADRIRAGMAWQPPAPSPSSSSALPPSSAPPPSPAAPPSSAP
jgi:hypothetical protein